MIKVTKIESEGGGCPYQVEGRTDDDRPVYARFRHGNLRVEVGQPGAGSTTWQDDTVFRSSTGDEWAGIMTYTELREHTKGEIEWPDYPEAEENRRSLSEEERWTGGEHLI